MLRFYQGAYSQSGLTTELPDDDTLARLMQSNFAHTSKDFRRFIELLEILSIPKGSKILDFGANWGYGMYQFRNAGFSVAGYEVSEPRASFAQKLGLSILTSWSDVGEGIPYDVVFSAHVLEHTPNPTEAVARQIALLRPGGHLVAVFPHGSRAYRNSDFASFHCLWGRVHPVLPSVEYLENILPSSNWFIGAMTETDLQKVAIWDGASPIIGDTTQSELLVVYRA